MEKQRNMFLCKHDTFSASSNNPQTRCTKYGHWGEHDKAIHQSTFCNRCNNLNNCEYCAYNNGSITVWNGIGYSNPCDMCSNRS